MTIDTDDDGGTINDESQGRLTVGRQIRRFYIKLLTLPFITI